MTGDVNFEDVLKFFESHGWKLKRIQGKNRVFTKKDQKPWNIPVGNRKVDVEYVKRFKRFLKERGED